MGEGRAIMQTGSDDIKERLNRIRKKMRHHQEEVIQKDLEILRNPPAEGFARGGEAMTLNDWQLTVANARMLLIKEMERLARMLGVVQAAVKIQEKSRANQLPPKIQEAVNVAKASKKVTVGISYCHLLKWRQMAKKGLPALAPKVPKLVYPPHVLAWQRALLALIREKQDISLEEAVKQLRSSGHKIHYKNAKAYVIVLADELRARRSDHQPIQ